MANFGKSINTVRLFILHAGVPGIVAGIVAYYVVDSVAPDTDPESVAFIVGAVAAALLWAQRIASGKDRS
jgi:hypothetical protein